ncbi:MAG: hypothetical protein V1866_05245 [archaeon]
MEFDKFLEKDMVDFLSEAAAKLADKAAAVREEEFDMFEITQDYSKEINSALKENDLRKAQHVFENVKNKYMQAPDNSMSKKRLYIIMEEIYEKIKDFESRDKGKKDLFESIKDYEAEGLFTRPELFEKKEEEKLSIILSSIPVKEKALERITSRDSLNSNELREAIRIYHELKALIAKIPEPYGKEKSAIAAKIVGHYYAIKKLKEQSMKKSLPAQPTRAVGVSSGKPAAQPSTAQDNPKPEDVRPVEDRLAGIRHLKSDIVMLHDKIITSINSKDLKSSLSGYKQMRKLCDEFPSELNDEKTALRADALSLYDKINKLKQELSEKHGAISQAEKPEPESKPEPKAGKPLNWTADVTTADVAAASSSKEQELAMEVKQLEKENQEKKEQDEKKSAELAVKEKQRDKIKAEADGLTILITENLQKKNIKEAVVLYRKLKKLCDDMPAEFDEDKEDLVADAVTTYSNIRILKEMMNAPSETKKEEAAAAKDENLERMEMQASIRDRLSHVKELLNSKDASGAIKEYRSLKEMFKQYPEDSVDEKKRLYDEIVGAHKDIVLLENDLKRKSSIDDNGEERAAKIKEIEGSLSGAKAMLDKHQSDPATQLLLEAKHRIQLLPREEFDEKYRLLKELEALEHKLLFSKNMQRMDSQGNVVQTQ